MWHYFIGPPPQLVGPLDLPPVLQISPFDRRVVHLAHWGTGEGLTTWWIGYAPELKTYLLWADKMSNS